MSSGGVGGVRIGQMVHEQYSLSGGRIRKAGSWSGHRALTTRPWIGAQNCIPHSGGLQLGFKLLGLRSINISEV